MNAGAGPSGTASHGLAAAGVGFAGGGACGIGAATGPKAAFAIRVVKADPEGMIGLVEATSPMLG